MIGSLVTHYKYRGWIGLVIASNADLTMNGRASRYTVLWPNGKTGTHNSNSLFEVINGSR